ncbi:MAG: hypothetical protein FJ290_02395 [Planctomycetes bacterium]|nr:hypothetical protein [Planctomycetota bacterium]
MPARHLIALAVLSFAACVHGSRALAAEEIGGDPWVEGEDARFDPEGIPYPDEAAKATDEFIAQAKEKGEKLALLHRLALTQAPAPATVEP